MKTITTIKRSLVAILAVAILVPSLQSCKKTVTPKKLDGEWNVTSGSTTSTYTSSTGTTTTTASTFDGAKETITTTPCVGCSPVINDKTVSFTFDKKAGTYTMVTVATENDVEEDRNYYTKNATTPVTYNNDGKFDRKIKAVSTTTEQGTYTVTGGTGEIEKNSQIVLSETSTVSNTDYTYTYFEAGTSTALVITDKYEQESSSGGSVYKLLVATKNELTTHTGKTFQNITMNVESLKKGVMEVNYSYSDDYTSGATTTKNTSETKWTLTEKE